MSSAVDYARFHESEREPPAASPAHVNIPVFDAEAPWGVFCGVATVCGVPGDWKVTLVDLPTTEAGRKQLDENRTHFGLTLTDWRSIGSGYDRTSDDIIAAFTARLDKAEVEERLLADRCEI